MLGEAIDYEAVMLPRHRPHQDFWRSVVRQCADTIHAQGRRLAGALAPQTLWTRIKEPRRSLEEGVLATLLARGCPSQSFFVRCMHGSIAIDSSSTGAYRLLPHRPRFAPQGAKEIRFAVQPSSVADVAEVRQVVSAIGAAIAHTLWWLDTSADTSPSAESLVVGSERGVLSADLARLSAVRRARSRPGLSLIIDSLGVRSIVVEEGRLVVIAGFEGL